MNSDPREMDTRGIQSAVIQSGQTSRWKWVAILAGLITISALAFSITDFVGQRDDAQSGEKSAKQTTQAVGDRATSLANEVLTACKGTGRDADALRAADLCGKASTTKAEVAKATPGLPGAPGAQGPRGLTGLPATFAEIAANVSDYCATHDQCRGPSGDDSAVPGPAGKDSTTPGPTGQSGKDGSDSTVPGPAGPAGADGAAGKDGQDGRGIAEATCGDDDRWIVTYTDGTTSDGGTCRVSLLPTP